MFVICLFELTICVFISIFTLFISFFKISYQFCIYRFIDYQIHITYLLCFYHFIFLYEYIVCTANVFIYIHLYNGFFFFVILGATQNAWFEYFISSLTYLLCFYPFIYLYEQIYLCIYLHTSTYYYAYSNLFIILDAIQNASSTSNITCGRVRLSFNTRFIH